MTPEQKTYTLTLRNCSDYLYAHITATAVGPEIVRFYMGEIINESCNQGVTDLLIERDIDHAMSDVYNFYAGVDLVSMGFDKLRVAFVAHSESDRQNLEFAMKVANNRGARARVFGSVKEAEYWLKSSDI